MAAEELVYRDAERVVVRLLEEQVLERLRGRVVRRHASLGQDDRLPIVPYGANAEIDDGYRPLVVAYHDVGWLQVFVYDARLMQHLEPVIQARDDPIAQIVE